MLLLFWAWQANDTVNSINIHYIHALNSQVISMTNKALVLWYLHVHVLYRAWILYMYVLDIFQVLNSLD